MKPREIPVCGHAAVEALYSKNPDAIKRLFFDRATSRKVAKISSFLAKAKRVYRMVEGAELEKIAGTLHHGGIVAIVDQAPLRAARTDELRAWAKSGAPLILLDRIGNAHNLGAIVRTAAFLGVRRVVIVDHPAQARPTEAAHRVAEGGMAHVEIVVTADLAVFCREIAPWFEVVGTAVAGRAVPLGQFTRRLTSGGAARKPVALVLGNEEHGLAPEVAAACGTLVTIPGSGNVESLNVSVAAAILLWELWGRHG